MSERIVNAKVQSVTQQQAPARKRTDKPGAGNSFAEVLESTQNLKISGHAQTRLNSRGIALSESDWSRVTDGVNRAASKGSRESLILTDKAALIVSVKNRTIITAVAREQLADNVFTNIDSAVIV